MGSTIWHQAAQAVWTKKGKRRVVGCFHEKEQESIGSEHKHKDGRRYQDWNQWEEEGSRQWQDEKAENLVNREKCEAGEGKTRKEKLKNPRRAQELRWKW